jgi:hypothetical protein
MKKRIIAAGALAGGIALTGLTGSAYAASGDKVEHRAKPTLAVPGKAGVKGPIAFICAAHVKGEKEKGLTSLPEPSGRTKKVGPTFRTGGREKGLTSLPEPSGLTKKVARTIRTGGKALPPPPGATVIARKGDTLKIKAPKGVHCRQVKPGTPGAPPVR